MMGNSAALLEQVLLEYKPKIYGYIAGKGVPLSDRDDVFGEILLKAARQAERYDSAKASVSTWVYIITRSVVVDHFRKHKAELPLTEDFPSGFDMEGRIDYEMELAGLAEQLRRLPDRERKVIVLRFYKELEYLEIARLMELSEVNTRKIYSRALKKLKELMKYDGDYEI